MVSRSIWQAFYGLNERSVRLLISYHCIMSILRYFESWSHRVLLPTPATHSRASAFHVSLRRPSDTCTSERFLRVRFTSGSIHSATFPSIGIHSKSDNCASDDFLMHTSLIYEDCAWSSVSRTVLASDALVHILQHTSELQHLQVKTVVSDKTTTVDIPRLRLTSLHLIYFSNSGEDLIALFRQMPALRRIQLNIYSLYFSDRELEKFIVAHLLQLERFQLNMEFRALADTKREKVVDQLLTTFQSSF